MVAAAGSGINASVLLAEAGIDPDGPWEPQAMVPDATYYDMLESIAGQIDVTDLAVLPEASMRLDEYGALGPAFNAATTLGGSFARVERYARLWTSVVEHELRPDPHSSLLLKAGWLRNPSLAAKLRMNNLHGFDSSSCRAFV